MPTWKDRPNPCRAHPKLFWPDLTYGDDWEETEVPILDPSTGEPIDRVATARRLCAGCPSRVECLDYAVSEGIEGGIYGGQGTDHRLWLRSQYNAGPDAYRVALARAIEELEAWADGRQVEHPEEICQRCGAKIRAGPRPIDRNGPGANCGKPSTYNRGCRCVPCVVAKAESDRSVR